MMDEEKDLREQKQKRAERMQQKVNHIRKEVKIAKEYNIPVKEPHKLHKTHVMNCGNPKCYMCGNPRKVFGEKTMQERRYDQKEKINES